jgi:hypothetical protein
MHSQFFRRYFRKNIQTGIVLLISRHIEEFNIDFHDKLKQIDPENPCIIVSKLNS